MLQLCRGVSLVVVLVVTGLGGCAGDRGRPAASATLVAPMGAATVQARTEALVLPTYPVGPASDFPEFGRANWYPRPSRDLYPYTAQRNLSLERRDQRYEAYVLENEYLRIEVLPALGGRLFGMYDRSAKQDVVYRQVSIKPGLVALRGAWISGGIEWNFPRSHSVTTFEPVSCQFLRHDDGSASIVIGDTERSFRMSWTVELRLYPGRANLETRIVCRNPTPLPHEGYWWSNASFPASERTQLIFPFHKVVGHGDGGLSDWPIRDGKDMSWYKDYPESTSIFRGAGDEDFVAAYDHGRDIGLTQYADHRVMPGRKWFSWGASDAGLRWARTLSDDNRPYVEIQSGCPLTQDDKFRMQPHEEKQFLEYWGPVSRIGPPARVNPDAAVRLTVDKGIATVGVMPMVPMKSARIEVSAGKRVLKQWVRDISPAEVFKETCAVGEAGSDAVKIAVYDQGGRQVIAHVNGQYAGGESAVEPATQRRGGTTQPQISSLEKAITQIAQGQSGEARGTLAPLVTGSGDSDAARFYLGLAEARLGHEAEAMAQWDEIGTKGLLGDAAKLEGAKLLLAESKWQEASRRLRPLLGRGELQAEAGVLAALAARQAGRSDEARRRVGDVLRHDPLMLLAQTELALLDGRDFSNLSGLRDEERRIEVATAYMAIRQYIVAERLLRPVSGSSSSPIASYLRAYVLELMGNAPEAARLRKEAAQASVRGCLPSRLEELAALDAAIVGNGQDASAHYLAGLVLYSRNRKQEAVAHWRQASALGHPDALVYRCLGGVLRDDDPREAAPLYERAVALAPDAPEIYADLASTYGQLGDDARRIAVLEKGIARLPDQDDLAHRLAVAYFDVGRYDEAVRCYQSRRFHVAEGQHDLHDNYATALMARAMTRLEAGRSAEALADLDAALDYPENLGIGRPQRGGSDPIIGFWRGVALSNVGRAEEARQAWQQIAGQMSGRRSGGEGRRSRRHEWIGPWNPEAGIYAVHVILSHWRLGQLQQAEALTADLETTLLRVDAMDPPDGKAYADMLRGLLDAGRPIDRPATRPSRPPSTARSRGGLTRLADSWMQLLRQVPATQALEP